MGNKFPRLSHENKYPISSAYINGNLRWLHHAGATYSKHERIQHRQISKLATNLNILRASFKAEFQASQLSDQNDICQSLIFSGHRDNKLWGLGPCQVEDSSPNLLLKESLCFVKETLLRKIQRNFWENNNSPWGRKYSTLGRFRIIGFPRCKAKIWHGRGKKEKPGWFRHCRFWGKLGLHQVD